MTDMTTDKIGNVESYIISFSPQISPFPLNSYEITFHYLYNSTADRKLIDVNRVIQ